MSEFQEWVENEFRIKNEIEESDISSNAFGTIVWDHQQQKISLMQKMIDYEREEAHRLIKSLSDIMKASFLESEESYSIARHALTAFDRDKIKQLEKELGALG